MRVIDTSMTNEQKYDILYNVLVDAYMNDTLAVGHCQGCAVGNIVAKALGINITRCKVFGGLIWEESTPKWSNVFTTVSRHILNKNDPKYVSVVRKNDDYIQILHNHSSMTGLIELQTTGLDLDVLMNIEWYFETGATGNSTDEIMFNGLSAVLKYLGEEFGIEESRREEKKKNLSSVFNINVNANILQKTDY